MSPLHRVTHRTAGFIVLACLTLACFVSLTSKADAEGDTERANVMLFFGYHWPDRDKIQSTTTVYNAQGEWVRSTTDSRLIMHENHVELRLAKGERIVEAFADYGTIATPTYENVEWDGKRPLPLYKYLKDASGKTWKIPLTDVSVEAYSPKRPLPPPKGTGVISEEPSGEMK